MVEAEDQERILDDHIQVVREQAFHMKKSLDQNNLRDALKFSSTMLGEMKTSRLSPRNYFNLCKLKQIGFRLYSIFFLVMLNAHFLILIRYDGF